MTESRDDRERLRDKLQRLPIFPLYRVQLFPRAILPLYVFGPRYRVMTAACLAGHGLKVLAQLKHPGEWLRSLPPAWRNARERITATPAKSCPPGIGAPWWRRN